MGTRSQLSLDPVSISRVKKREPSRVDMSHVSRVLDIPTDKLYRKAGSIDLLIGTNSPSSHVGETKVNDGLVAPRTPFGWVIFGSNSGYALPKAKQFLHVRLALPVDITGLWKTESIGVSVSPCTYEAPKMSSKERAELK